MKSMEFKKFEIHKSSSIDNWLMYSEVYMQDRCTHKNQDLNWTVQSFIILTYEHKILDEWS